jgi:hypothetical protein
VKNIVYQVKVNDLQHLKARMRDTAAAVTRDILQATWNEVEYRMDNDHLILRDLIILIILGEEYKL